MSTSKGFWFVTSKVGKYSGYKFWFYYTISYLILYANSVKVDRPLYRVDTWYLVPGRISNLKGWWSIRWTMVVPLGACGLCLFPFFVCSQNTVFGLVIFFRKISSSATSGRLKMKMITPVILSQITDFINAMSVVLQSLRHRISASFFFVGSEVGVLRWWEMFAAIPGAFLDEFSMNHSIPGMEKSMYQFGEDENKSICPSFLSDFECENEQLQGDLLKLY